MESIWNILIEIGIACLRFFTQPFYYIGLLFIVLQYRRQLYLERKLFHTKLHSVTKSIIHTIFWGMLLGIPASALMLGLGTLLDFKSLIWLWGLTLLFSLFRVRFMCYAYAAGTLGLLYGLVHLFESFLQELSIDWLQVIIQSIQDLHIPSILALAAVMHFVEALLVRWQGTRTAMPIFWEGNRGKVIGGYHMQGFWLVPLLLIVPVTGSELTLPWTPLFGSSAWAQGWSLVAFPVMIGFSSMTTTRLPIEKAKRNSIFLLVYSIVLLGAAIGAEYFAWFIIPASLLSIVLHEFIIWLSRYEENAKSAYFVHSQQGLRILSVIPKSPAAQLGIVAGEIIYKVNGKRILTKEQLHQAIRENSAFTRLELFDLKGENKFVQRAMYEGEHHQLGIILAPDERTQFVLESDEISIAGMIWMKLSGVLRRGDKKAKRTRVHDKGTSASG